MTSHVELEVDGMRVLDWKRIQVDRSLASVAGRFTVELLDTDAFPAPPGSEARVLYRNSPLITGTIEDLEIELTGTATAGGRDLTADLVDSSATWEAGEWFETPLDQIVRDILDPFGISLVVESQDLGEPFSVFALEEGETAWSVIERACRQRGVLCTSFGDGLVRLVDAEQFPLAGVSLIQGQNLKTARLVATNRDRFRDYIVQGSRPGSDDEWGSLVAAVEGTAGDSGIDRYRPLKILAEGVTTEATARRRAEWEAVVRRGRASRVVAELEDWAPEAGGIPWRVNTVVGMFAFRGRVRQNLLIDTVQFRADRDGGTEATLTLVSPDTYTRRPDADEMQDPLEAWTESLR